MTRAATTREPVGRAWVIVALLIAAAIAALAAFFASGDPDGLERVAEDQGFLDRARDAFYQFLPDYTIPGVEGPASTAIAGFVGIAVVFVLLYLLGRALSRRSR